MKLRRIHCGSFYDRLQTQWGCWSAGEPSVFMASSCESESQPTSAVFERLLLRLAAALRARDIGDERFGVDSQGESSPPPLPSRPPPSGGESSATQSPLTAPEAAVLFLGLSHPTAAAAAATANLRDSGPAAAASAVFS
ncbi:hypothetical protein D9C73_006927 [Collichthys lucidus]|uniref:Uncharacterized protein n=1 Tax=Collichthys lucidus TaxID=240159 RepID=A0A4U5UFK5_COLLU|nr:hypothetical protein D9C73_006927 [Collichthys lucidus]